MDPTTNISPEEIAAFVLIFMVMMIINIIFLVIILISYWKIFEKAGKPEWAAIVPFYNMFIMVEVAQKPTWWFAMMFVPFANIVFMIMIMNGVSKSFGKTEGFTVGLVLLPIIFFPILAFGSAKYLDKGNSVAVE